MISWTGTTIGLERQHRAVIALTVAQSRLLRCRVSRSSSLAILPNPPFRFISGTLLATVPPPGSDAPSNRCPTPRLGFSSGREPTYTLYDTESPPNRLYESSLAHFHSPLFRFSFWLHASARALVVSPLQIVLLSKRCRMRRQRGVRGFVGREEIWPMRPAKESFLQG
jgi:hypothetical protein